MKQRGFVFVETIVIIVVLTLGFMSIYVSFSSVLTNSKRRAAYNDIEYIYRTYYIQDFISSLDIEKWAKHYLVDEGKKIQEFSCNNLTLYKIDGNVSDSNGTGLSTTEQYKKEFCEKFIVKMKAKHIYITRYNVDELKKQTTYGARFAKGSVCSTSDMNEYKKYQDLCSMSTNMIYYLRTLSGSSLGYRIIVEYEEELEDKDSTITMMHADKVNGSCPNNYELDGGKCRKCPDGYKKSGSTCYRKIKRNYYANVEMVLKSEL